ncbi:MAG: phosphoribosyl-ATP diphosphatase [SAR324 cluster bacterium]|nr:phosphoribosyl-ATP diphosphatase [SAR324 cluster bacterium]
MSEINILSSIFAQIKANKDKNPANSYSARLYQSKKGKNKVLEKLGEEAVETIIAAKDGNKEQLINEMADLWFHSLATLAIHEVELTDLFDELQRRQKVYK